MSKVIFAKPDIPSLKKQGCTCIDMHCHSRYSDGISSIESIYRKCRKLGIGVALTDHNEIKGAMQIVKYRNFNAIPGIETTSSEGIHTLFYFYDAKELEQFYKKCIEKSRAPANPFSDLKKSVIELVEESRKFSCRIASAHPFGPWNTGIHKFANIKKYKEAIKKIDFIEGINSSTLHSANKKAVEWAEKLGKSMTGGSDAHASVFIGKVITASKGDEFLDSLKKDSLVVGKEVNRTLLYLRSLLKMRQFSRFPKFYIKKLINYTSK